jgi:hypothetical protein
MLSPTRSLNRWQSPLSYLKTIGLWHLGSIVTELVGYSVSDFKLKHLGRTLIVGTGKSAQCLTVATVRDHDTIIAINYGIRHPALSNLNGLNKNLLWYSADPLTVLKLAQDLFLHPEFTALFHPASRSTTLKVQLNPLLRGRVKVLKTVVFLDQYIQMILGVDKKHDQASNCLATHPSFDKTVRYCERFLDRLANYPSGCGFNSTSALPLIVLAARLGSSHISLIGCDFDNSRVNNKDQGTAHFANNPEIVRYFFKISECLLKRGVAVDNLSWKHVPPNWILD